MLTFFLNVGKKTEKIAKYWRALSPSPPRRGDTSPRIGGHVPRVPPRGAAYGVEIKLRHHLLIECRLIKGIGDNFGVTAIVLRLSTKSKTVIRSPFRGISDNHSQLHQQLGRTGAMLSYHPFGYNQKGNQEDDYTLLFFLRWNTSC